MYLESTVFRVLGSKFTMLLLFNPSLKLPRMLYNVTHVWEIAPCPELGKFNGVTSYFNRFFFEFFNRLSIKKLGDTIKFSQPRARMYFLASVGV